MFSDEESLAFGVDASKTHKLYRESMLLKGDNAEYKPHRYIVRVVVKLFTVWR